MEPSNGSDVVLEDILTEKAALIRAQRMLEESESSIPHQSLVAAQKEIEDLKGVYNSLLSTHLSQIQSSYAQSSLMNDDRSPFSHLPNHSSVAGPVIGAMEVPPLSQPPAIPTREKPLHRPPPVGDILLSSMKSVSSSTKPDVVSTNIKGGGISMLPPTFVDLSRHTQNLAAFTSSMKGDHSSSSVAGRFDLLNVANRNMSPLKHKMPTSVVASSSVSQSVTVHLTESVSQPDKGPFTDTSNTSVAQQIIDSAKERARLRAEENLKALAERARRGITLSANSRIMHVNNQGNASLNGSGNTSLFNHLSMNSEERQRHNLVNTNENGFSIEPEVENALEVVKTLKNKAVSDVHGLLDQNSRNGNELGTVEGGGPETNSVSFTPTSFPSEALASGTFSMQSSRAAAQRAMQVFEHEVANERMKLLSSKEQSSSSTQSRAASPSSPLRAVRSTSRPSSRPSSPLKQPASSLGSKAQGGYSRSATPPAAVIAGNGATDRLAVELARASSSYGVRRPGSTAAAPLGSPVSDVITLARSNISRHASESLEKAHLILRDVAGLSSKNAAPGVGLSSMQNENSLDGVEPNMQAPLPTSTSSSSVSSAAHPIPQKGTYSYSMQAQKQHLPSRAASRVSAHDKLSEFSSGHRNKQKGTGSVQAVDSQTNQTELDEFEGLERALAPPGVSSLLHSTISQLSASPEKKSPSPSRLIRKAKLDTGLTSRSPSPLRRLQQLQKEQQTHSPSQAVDQRPSEDGSLEVDIFAQLLRGAAEKILEGADSPPFPSTSAGLQGPEMAVTSEGMDVQGGSDDSLLEVDALLRAYNASEAAIAAASVSHKPKVSDGSASSGSSDSVSRLQRLSVMDLDADIDLETSLQSQSHTQPPQSLEKQVVTAQEHNGLRYVRTADDDDDTAVPKPPISRQVSSASFMREIAQGILSSSSSSTTTTSSKSSSSLPTKTQPRQETQDKQSTTIKVPTSAYLTTESIESPRGPVSNIHRILEDQEVASRIVSSLLQATGDSISGKLEPEQPLVGGEANSSKPSSWTFVGSAVAAVAGSDLALRREILGADEAFQTLMAPSAGLVGSTASKNQLKPSLTIPVAAPASPASPLKEKLSGARTPHHKGQHVSASSASSSSTSVLSHSIAAEKSKGPVSRLQLSAEKTNKNVGRNESKKEPVTGAVSLSGSSTVGSSGAVRGKSSTMTATVSMKKGTNASSASIMKALSSAMNTLDNEDIATTTASTNRFTPAPSSPVRDARNIVKNSLNIKKNVAAKDFHLVKRVGSSNNVLMSQGPTPAIVTSNNLASDSHMKPRSITRIDSNDVPSPTMRDWVKSRIGANKR